jgi:hypothetical protein
MQHEHDWLIPSPLWSSNGYRQVEFFRPALFEFRTDQFMEEFLAAAANASPLALRKARMLTPADSSEPNRLFQPAHGCFYLAAASLCCREPGFPSRLVERGAGENTAVVLRKIVDGKEYGWVIRNDQKGWKPLNETARTLLEGEERLPAFTVPLAGGRQMSAAYISTASSDTYNIPPAELAVDGQELNSPIKELDSRFIAPFSSGLLTTMPDIPAWTTSVYLLVELVEYLTTYLPEVANALKIRPQPAVFTGEKITEKATLMLFLDSQPYKGSLTMADALQAVAKQYAELNIPGGGDLDRLNFKNPDYNLRTGSRLNSEALNTLRERVRAALPDELPPLKVPKLDVSVDVQYVVRFVYERPQCEPPQINVSLPSQPFTFAPFFDPDAPARPIKIPLPSDVSIAGLRKFKKNVTFMMSDAMRKKMDTIAGKETELLQGGGIKSEDTNAFAFVCSFSFQIIFIVAFMLLMIFVVVFNIIFWWIAFFRICLPVPKKLLPS